MALLVSRTFSLAIADQIATACVTAVKDLNVPKPVSVTVVDNSGAIIVQKRMDGGFSMHNIPHHNWVMA